MATYDALSKATEQKMKKGIEAMQKAFAGVRTGKASPQLVDGVMVDYYGTMTRLKDIAAITAPEPRLLVIQPWDQAAIKPIEKAIIASNLGISPMSDGRVVRLPIPELSEERRKALVKQVKERGEDARIEIRNCRRDGNEAAKKGQKDGQYTEDEKSQAEKAIQKLTDACIREVDELLKAKEAELMQV